MLFVTLAIPLITGLGGCTGATVASTSQSSIPGLPMPATTSKTTSSTPAASDYRKLLLSAADLSDADDTFSARSTGTPPSGSAGATGVFVNDRDNRAISDTFLVYPDVATARATLRQAAATLPTLVAGGALKSSPVGSDAVTISGTEPADQKAVTLLFFTEGPALVRLEFQSATGDATTDRFVTTVGKMQQIALRVGLADSSS